MKKVVKISGIGLAVIFLPYLTWYAGHGQSLSAPETIPGGFKGTFLAASDADMLGGAYADGVLNKVKGIEDSLTLIEVKNGVPKIISQRHASNSVISWPSIIALSPNKRFVYVAETRAVYQGGMDKVKDVGQDIPIGRKVAVFDLQDPANPVLIQEKSIGENIQGVSVNHSGDLLVAGSSEPTRELTISRLKNGQIEKTFYFQIKGIKQTEKNNKGIRTIEFHPLENIIAANINDESVLFYRVKDDGTEISIQQVGEPLEVAKHWSVGNWHPSGKYFILTDVAWGNGALGFLFNGKGKLVSVKFDEQGNHEIVSKIKVGLSPEGSDLSPDGNYAITVNMRRTWTPPKGYWFVPAKKYASLSLIKVNPETGELSKLGDDYGFKGALPEDAIFDSEGNSIAVAVYHDRDDRRPTQGWIDFWELKEDKLVLTETKVKVTRGVHNLLLVN